MREEGCRHLRWARWWATVAALAMVGCGEVSIDLSGVDALIGGQDVATDVTGDGATGGSDGVTTDGVDPGDTGGQDTAGGCTADAQCASLKGQTPCRQPKCVEGACKLVDFDVGTSCSPLEPLGPCEAGACNAAGGCEVTTADDGKLCIEGTCTHVCKSGSCTLGSVGDWDDENPCTVETCDPLTGKIASTDITDTTLPCEPDSLCLGNGFCVEGKCAGQPKDCSDGIACSIDTCDPETGCKHTKNPTVCDDGDPCTIDGCDLATDCTATGANDGTACDDGKDCTKDDACEADGECEGTPICSCESDTDCDQSDLCEPQICSNKLCIVDAAAKVKCSDALGTYCQAQVCNPTSGVCEGKAKNEGKDCDDGDPCSTASKCASGSCAPTATKDCNDTNACTNDACVGGSGCVFEPNTASCDDGDACTSNDACNTGACTGALKDCADGVDCTVDACDAKTGKCSNTPADLGCSDNNPCTTDACDSKNGCTHASDDKAGCDDGKACTADVCSGGKCVSTNQCDCEGDADCNDNNPCTVDACKAGKCSNDAAAAEGKGCDTADKCQLPGSGQCAAGTCKSGNKPKVCSDQDGPCQVGSCDPFDGKCKAKPKGDGTPCDADGNGCTENDACKAGACTAGKPVDCSAQGEACKVGSCSSTGANSHTCAVESKPAGSPCDDGKFCTEGDTCDSAGTCKAGKPRTCAELSDACNLGACDETKSSCVATPKGSGVGCDDGLYCTEGEACDGKGKCAGGKPLDCPGDLAACKQGYCDEAGDACKTKSAPAGSTCDDGNLCTSGDACGSAGCVGPDEVSCKGDACNAGACDAKTGLCKLVPLQSGTPCDDGQKCTTKDACDGSGTCKGGAWDLGCGCQKDADCNDGNACTKDTCSGTSCVFSITNGASCDDGDPCSVTSACDATGKCIAKTEYDCSKAGDACNDALCVAKGSEPSCKKVPKAAGTACSDGLACTSKDTCTSTGVCKGSPVVCSSSKTCHVATCDEKAGGCTDIPSSKGTSCSDGNPCTAGDVCDGAGACLAGDSLPNFSKCDDGNAATSGDFCSSNVCKGFVMTPAPGVVHDVAYSTTAKTFHVAGSAATLSGTVAGGPWHLYAASVAKGGGVTLASAANISTSSPPMMAASDHVAVGRGGQIWLLYSSGGIWKWSTSASNVLATAVVKAFGGAIGGVNWNAVDSMVIGSTLHVSLAGYDTSAKLAIMANCNGSSTGVSSFTCTVKKYASWIQPVGASTASSKSSPFSSVTTPEYDIAALVGSSASPSNYTTLYRYAWNGSSAYASQYAGGFAATGNTAGALLRYNSNGLSTNGASTMWLAGPGVVRYQKTGTTAYYSATVVGTNQAAYLFRDIFYANGGVFIVADKPGSSASIRVPVLLVHREIIDQQSGTAYWNELQLQTPASSCGSFNGLAHSGGDSNGSTAFVLGASYCAAPSKLKGYLYDGVVYSRF